MFQLTIATVTCVLALTSALAPPARAAAAPPATTQAGGDDPLLAPRGTCTGDDDPAAQHRIQRLAMHCLIDYLRREAGLPRLRPSVTLRHSAIYKARRIAACKVFTHNPCGDKLAVPFQEAQLTRHGRWLVGEDLAWGVGQDATARAILAKWLASPSHRRVLLDRTFTHVGLRRRRLSMQGAPRGSILWVAHLGRPETH